MIFRIDTTKGRVDNTDFASEQDRSFDKEGYEVYINSTHFTDKTTAFLQLIADVKTQINEVANRIKHLETEYTQKKELLHWIECDFFLTQ